MHPFLSILYNLLMMTQSTNSAVSAINKSQRNSEQLLFGGSICIYIISKTQRCKRWSIGSVYNYNFHKQDRRQGSLSCLVQDLMDQKSEPSLQFCLDIKIPLVEYIARQFCPLLLIVTGCFFGQSQQFSDFNIRHTKAESARQSAYETFSRLNELYCQLGKTGRASSQ